MMKPNGYRQFNKAYIEIKKQGKSELAAEVALLLACGNFNHNTMVLLIDMLPHTTISLKIANTLILSARPTWSVWYY